MAIYFPDGNGGRKRVEGFGGGENFSLADLKLTGFSEVADATGEITDGDNLLVALAKCWNRRPASATRVRTPSQQVALTYNGLKQSPVWNGFNSEQLSIVSGNEETNAGIYTTTFALKEGFEWEDGTTGNKGVQWKIERAAITNVPSQSNTLFYDGTPKAPAWRNYSANQLTIGGTTSATEAGTYNATFTPTANYSWADGTIVAKTVTWAIGRSVADTVPKVATTLRYTGAVQSPTWNNYDSARLDIGGTTSATNVGAYVATFTPKNGVVWADGKSDTKSVEWTIERATIAIPSVTGTTFTYNGNNQAPVVGSYDDSLVVVTGNAPQVNAGTYSVVCSIKDKANYQWTDGTIVDISTPWTIRKVSVAVPTVTSTSFTYDEGNHNPIVGNYDGNYVTVTGNAPQVNSGTYSVVCSIKDTANYQWANGTIDPITTSWTIQKKSLSVPSVTNKDFTYDGASHNPTIGTYDSTYINTTGTTAAQTNAGTYIITFALKNTTNYQWSDGTTANKQVSWTINKKSLSVPSVTNKEFTYDGGSHSPTVGTYDPNYITVTNTAQTNLGNYTVTFALKNTTNCQWTDGTTANKTVSWKIKGITINVPYQTGTLTYTGSTLTPQWNNYNTSQLTIGGTTSSTNAGTYTAKFTPKGQYVWSDNTQTTKDVTWTIGAQIISTVPTQNGTLTYTGSSQSPKWNNYNTSQLTIGGTTSSTSAGTYTATFTPKANYAWSNNSTAAKNVTWEIARQIISAVPTQNGTLTYTGSTLTPQWNNYNTNQLAISGDTSATDAGEYRVWFETKENYCWKDGSTGNEIAYWTINPKRLSAAQSTFKQSNTLTFKLDSNGDYVDQSPTISGFNSNLHEWYWRNEPAGSTAGIYTERIALKDPGNYIWYDGTTDWKEVEWEIKPKKLSVPSISNTTFTYDGDKHRPTITGFDPIYMRWYRSKVDGKNWWGGSNATLEDMSEDYAGEFVLEWDFNLKASGNCVWSDGTAEPKEFGFTIKPRVVTAPSVTNLNFTYDGNEHGPTIGSYDSKYVYVGGTQRATKKGSYLLYLTPALNGSNVNTIYTNITWNDGTTDTKKYTWTIT